MIMNYDGVILGGFDILRPQDVENCVDPVSPLRKIFTNGHPLVGTSYMEAGSPERITYNPTVLEGYFGRVIDLVAGKCFLASRLPIMRLLGKILPAPYYTKFPSNTACTSTPGFRMCEGGPKGTIFRKKADVWIGRVGSVCQILFFYWLGVCVGNWATYIFSSSGSKHSRHQYRVAVRMYAMIIFKILWNEWHRCDLAGWDFFFLSMGGELN